MNFVPRGKYDTNVYRKNEDIDERVQTLQFLGNFKDNFSVVDNNDINDITKSGTFMANYSLHPQPLPYSRQIYEPIFENKPIETNNIAHSDNFFKLGDPVFGAHGSNLNAPGSNQHKTPFNELNLLQDSVDELFRKVDENTVNQMITKVGNTHTDTIGCDYDNSNNLSQPIKSINEYDFKKDQFLDRNVRGIKEGVYEYTIYINSADRDCVAYPNPFNYRVEFNPTNTTKNAYIQKYFKNIKFMHLKSVITPRRYYVINKPTNLIYDSVSNTSIEFVTKCINTSNNNSICNYVRQQGIINYYGTIFYFTFYSMQINTINYYICTHDIFLYTNYRQKDDINKLPDVTTNDIDKWLNFNDTSLTYYPATNSTSVIPPTPYVSISLSPQPNTQYNSWILIKNTPLFTNQQYYQPPTPPPSVFNPYPQPPLPILQSQDPNGGKITFCRQDDHFNELIDQTFEFTYDVNNNIVANTFDYYILTGTSLEDDRYLLLSVQEIDTMYEYSTDQNIETSFSVLLPDYVNGDYYYLDTANHEKVFDHGSLGNLSKMTISYKNASGKDLSSFNINIIDYDVTTPNTLCICTFDPNTGEKIRNYQCSHSYLRHPAFEKLQNTITMKIGVLEGTQDIQFI